jgi:hypothetical protein
MISPAQLIMISDYCRHYAAAMPLRFHATPHITPLPLSRHIFVFRLPFIYFR